MLNDNFPVMPHQSTMSGKLIGLNSISNNTLKNKFCYDNHVNGKIENEKAGTVVNICGVCYSWQLMQKTAYLLHLEYLQTQSTVPCGAAPCPPIPLIVMVKISAAAMTGPDFIPTVPLF